jgi:chemosensory pili system protein ChpA (sensor histidine kinase/response regulator)
MADNRNFAALDWLIHEIGETLREARQSLEAYVENPKDAVRIRFCLTHIHQVHGSLQMVEFYGAAMLADEMEQLTQAMINNAVSNPAEAQEVLMRAILQFPLYLDQVKTTRKDNPLVVLPLLNDLRAVRGENLLTDTKLFVPNLAPAKRITGTRLPATYDNTQFQAMALKLRQMYQYAAAGFIRGVNPEENLAYLQKVFARLNKLTQGTARQPLWDISLALAEALQMDALEISVSIKNLLRQLDREIKLLVVHGTKALNSYTKDDLIKNLLYYVARSGKHAPGFAPDSHLQRICINYQLDQALLEGKETGDESTNILSAPDADAMRSVVGALKDELDVIKHALDLCLTGNDGTQALGEALPVLKRVADTMAVLGIGELRKRVLEQGAVLERFVQSHSELSPDQLMAVASNILAVENALDNLTDQSTQADLPAEADVTLSRAKESVLRESRNGLEHAKDAIIEYIASQWDRSHLQTVPDTLRGIRGGLEIMPLPRPARILGACARYVEEQLLAEDAAPQWSSLDTLADAITSVEYYLERLSSGVRKEENDLLLGVAEDSVASLGYAVAKMSRTETSINDTSAHPDASSDVADDETAALMAAYENALIPDAAQTGDDRAAASSVNNIRQITESSPAASTASDDNDIDHEIIEIFVEEAGEVIQTIAQYFPRWAQNFDDNESLTEFRRAFHTLKGSGRMVGATEIGELAWSIENMLNRIIDHTITAGPAHVAIIEKVRALFPDMVAAFHHQQSDPRPQLTEAYRSQAESLAKGIIPPELENATPESSPLMLASVDEHEHEDDDETAERLGQAYSKATENLSGDMDDSELAEIDADGDAQLWDIFGNEAISHLQVLQDYVVRMEELAPVYEPPSEEMQRALHTLKGSAHMADITPIAELATPLEKFVKEMRSYHININEDILQLLRDAASYTQIALDNIENREPIEIPRLNQFIARVHELRELHVAPLVRLQEADDQGKRPVDPELLAIFMAEEMNLLLNADQIIFNWQSNPGDLQQLVPLTNELRNLTYGAAHAYLPPMADLGEKLQHIYHAILVGQLEVSDELCATLNRAHLALLDMVDAVAAGQNLIVMPEEIANALAAFTGSSVSGDPEIELSLPDSGNEQESTAEAVQSSDGEISLEIPAAQEKIALQEMSAVDMDYIALQVPAENDFNVAPSELENIAEQDLTAPEENPESVSDENFYSEDTDSSSILENSARQNSNTASSDWTGFDTSTAVEDYYSGAGAESDVEREDVFPRDEFPEQTSAELEEVELTLPDDDDTSIVEDIESENITLADDMIVDGEVVADDIELTLPEDTDAFSEALSRNNYPIAGSDNLPDFDNGAATGDVTLGSFEDQVALADEDLSANNYLALGDEAREAVADGFELTLSEDDAPINQEFAASSHLDVDNEIGVSDETAAEFFAANNSSTLSNHTQNPTESSAVVQDTEAFNAADDEDFDPEIIEIFIEEAGELLEDIERALHEWQDDWNNTECVEDLKRSLHTFKGGARLAGLTDIGDLSHEFESVLIEMGSDAEIDQNFFRRMNNFQDNLHTLVKRASARLAGDAEPATALVADVAPQASDATPSTLTDFSPASADQEQVGDDEISSSDSDSDDTAVDTANVVPFTPKPKITPVPAGKQLSADSPGMRAAAPGGALAPVQHLAARRAGPQEVVKVSADLLEELVNLAGETSISRGRMEQQVSDLGISIEEMDSTIQRLQEQLRRLDIETEAQVLFRQEQMAQHEGFDPLEMDRYSQLQQLSRSLIESASDLMDLKFTLADKTRDTETLLLQQSRINTDLQEGLMRSRMVPFSRLVPRLRRIVRQAATELGKEVDFELDNVEGELDRSVLERMVAPLEHMLRNAVDHGIETPDERAKAGKPEAGRIVLSLGREGGDVMLRLADDGRGINLQRVREKAIERGLMSADAHLSDQDIIQFILHAGFSTADKVTQISGRGVGMDVVHSEIKQLGGSMFIDSNWGEGTEFIVRLPFTVSVNRALMVQIGDDLYAIPLNTIEGIVRVSPFELEHYYQDEQARFEYAGENYLVRYLGTMLDSDSNPKLDGQSLPLPVVLVRSTENTVALQVDRLLGSREIVVKTLGAQFSAVRGVSGATVMGDGSVVVILDLHAMIREQLALGLGTSVLLEPFRVNAANDEDQAEKTVMVVDDSVTVRKVTSRFLEREGFIVITAKDGVEALQLLQDHIPDVMLLDIEMPRMDGFEVAKNIRTSSRLKDIPIIMITSRTGEKHRDHAFSLGVNKYLGKPYQEDLLLSSIRDLLGRPSN